MRMYKVLRTTNDLGGLEREVEEALAQGWELQGGICASYFGETVGMDYVGFYQAMTKTVDDGDVPA